MSLDDFYLPRAERVDLAKSIHPLAITRGPPGTHDVETLVDVIKKFNKALDDRLKKLVL